ncbi:MAG: IPT/TIG domain-containing protein [Candidatus Acidiferrales bacterium]
MTLLASDVASPGTGVITVSNPIPGGGVSQNGAPFVIYPTQANTPLISSLSPTNASPNSTSATVTVNGTNFVSGNSNNPSIPNPTPPYTGSVVSWNGSPRATSFVSVTQLTAQLSSTDLLTAGCNSISVYTYTSGGNVIYSPSVGFTVSSSGAPAICSISPASVVAGAPDFTITVNGASFSSGATVKWNGSSRTTTFVSASTVTAQIKAADVANAGSIPVTVANSGGAVSPPLNFAVTPTPLATPTITSVAPSSATAGGLGFTLTIKGTNFFTNSVVDWNGGARVTTFSSATSLTAQIQSEDIATAGTAEITVLNTNLNGGVSVSAPVAFTISATGSATAFPLVVSVSAAGGPADGPSEAPAVSSTGRYVAFYSQAHNLIAPANSGNIFVRDTCAGATNCTPKTLAVDVAPEGGAPNGKAGRKVAISGDGRFVAFVSRATNLVAGNNAASLGYWELYVRDLCQGANAPSGCTPHTEVISTSLDGGAANGPSSSPSLSGDGRFVAFLSAATNLVTEKSALLPQAYVRDTCAGPTGTKSCVPRTVAVPVDDDDRIAGAQAGRLAISADGRYVVLEMWAAKPAVQNTVSTSQVVLADTCLGIDAPVYCVAAADRVSYAPDGAALTGANIAPSLSNDGRFVVFESQPPESSGGNGATASKVFLRDACLGETAPDGCVPSTTPIVNDSSAATAKLPSFSPAISASGRYISFVSVSGSSTAAGSVSTEGLLVIRDSCFGAIAPCTAHTYAVPSNPGSLANSPLLRTSLGSFSGAKPAAGASAVIADRYTAAPLSDDGRFAAFYAPDTVAAEPASGVGDVYLTVTPF